jgi:hypothetical protein
MSLFQTHQFHCYHKCEGYWKPFLGHGLKDLMASNWVGWDYCFVCLLLEARDCHARHAHVSTWNRFAISRCMIQTYYFYGDVLVSKFYSSIFSIWLVILPAAQNFYSKVRTLRKSQQVYAVLSYHQPCFTSPRKRKRRKEKSVQAPATPLHRESTPISVGT